MPRPRATPSRPKRFFSLRCQHWGLELPWERTGRRSLSPWLKTELSIVLLVDQREKRWGVGCFSPVKYRASLAPPLHIKTKYAQRLSAFGVPAAASRKEASGSRSVSWVSLAVGMCGLAQRDAVTVGSFPVLRTVLTQALPHSAVRFLSPWSQGSGSLGHHSMCFSFGYCSFHLAATVVKRAGRTPVFPVCF